MIKLAAYQGVREKFAQAIVANNWKMLDVGGGISGFPHATATMDIQSHATYVGDICKPEVWEMASHVAWDAIVCSHTLEDVRDPYFVLGHMARLAPRWLIVVPHKHTELAVIDNGCHVGYCHHRWVFTLQQDCLRMLAKWPITARFSAIGDARGTIPWLKEEIALRGDLQIWCEGDLNFELVNGDWAGPAHEGCDGMLQMYRTELAEGL